jgi:hypothetical protein
MKRQVLTFGLICGAILGGMTAVMVPLCMNGTATFDHAEIFGYTIQVFAFLLVFFGIRSYRESAGGTITFGKAFQVGILVTLIACAVYVISWEIVYYNFVPDFADKYAAHVLEKLRTKGATQAAIAAATREMTRFKELYRNPFINAGMTFMEVFPVGLIVTAISAAILRRKTPRATGSPVVVAG